MYAIVDVHNRGGASSLGTVLRVGQTHYTQATIDKVALKRAGGPGSSGYIPCVGVRLKSQLKSPPVYVEQIIGPSDITAIWGTDRVIRGIADDPYRELKAMGIIPSTQD